MTAPAIFPFAGSFVGNNTNITNYRKREVKIHKP